MTMRIRVISVVLLVMSVNGPLHAQVEPKGHDFEVTTGVSASLYQSVFSFQQSSALEAALRSRITGAWCWQLGARLGFNPALPEVFARLLVAPEIDAWQPAVGLELGVTRRARFDAGKQLLREMRMATEGDISPFYVAVHTAPLSFRLWDRWRVSVLEMQLGTHLGHIGRTLRAQVGILSVGVTP